MQPLILGRADIGVGSLTITDEGITRRRLVRTSSIAFADIIGYRLALAYRADWDTAQQLLNTWWLRPSRAAWDMELFGPERSVQFNWRFDRVELAISRVVQRIHERLTAPRRDHALAGQFVQFGPLWLSKTAIRWANGEPLARDDVEVIDVFDDGTLRVMKRGKVFPYGKAALGAIPDVLSALSVAVALGYRLGGLEHLAPISSELAIA